ncbi:MAG: crossover junction endodeoxyribonuclease RuvC [Tistlia sp.]|uniref:crossover junction endodeoxyribonuclease RuvC n=1 Tax=Tistlia sp. TaxID=3057121 RepID=UPI0034A4D5DA
MRVIGLDPGLRLTGWGVIEARGNRLSHVAHGVLRTDDKAGLAERLVALKAGLEEVIAAQRPDAAAVEETLANRNPASTMKLGMARGIALLVPALVGLSVTQYLPMIVKKSVVGTGHAAKEQVAAMVAVLLPGSGFASADAADALAVAICHAHHSATRAHWAGAAERAGAIQVRRP